ncbi:MAG: restriction endonuclease subunit S, partial [Clostridia bacterium]|nr:restriction endonuclease subunit S [Clostridia bacterium]
FLFYQIKYMRKQLVKQGNGSIFTNLKTEILKEFPISIPAKDGRLDTETQNRIVFPLISIEDKIELNNSICAELEAMAKQLYDYWFVQFDFPDENGKPYKSSGGKMVWNEELKRKIPEGWEIITLGELFDKINDGCSASATNNLPYTPVDTLPTKKMSFSEFKSDEEANSSLIKYSKYDILFGAMRAYFHRVCIAPFNGITRTTTFVLRPKRKEELGYAFETINTDFAVAYAVANSVGTQQPYAEWDSNFADMKLACPPQKLRVKYSKKIHGIIEAVVEYNLQNQQLTSLRDFLLPMLMNGQVKVK